MPFRFWFAGFAAAPLQTGNCSNCVAVHVPTRFRFAQKPSFRSAIHLQKKNGSLPPAQSPLRQNLWITGFFFRLHLKHRSASKHIRIPSAINCSPTLAALPHGVLQRTPEIIQLSSNLATVRQLGDNVEIVESLRASSQALLSEGRDLVVHTADRASFQSSQQDYYPPGNRKRCSAARTVCTNLPIIISAAHALGKMFAGVECAFSRNVALLQEMILSAQPFAARIQFKKT